MNKIAARNSLMLQGASGIACGGLQDNVSIGKAGTVITGQLDYLKQNQKGHTY